MDGLRSNLISEPLEVVPTLDTHISVIKNVQSVSLYIYIHIHIYTPDIYICMYICVYVCMYIYIYIKSGVGKNQIANRPMRRNKYQTGT